MSESKTMTAPSSPQDRAFAAWCEQVTQRIEEHGRRFSELPDRLQKQLAEQFNQEIAKISDQVESLESFNRRRFHQLASHYHRGGGYRGPFESRDQAEAFGALVVASLTPRDSKPHQDAMGVLNEKFSVTPATGPMGGLIMPETLYEGILNRLPDYGMFFEDCPARPASETSKALTFDDGFVLYHPDVEAAPTPSEGTFAAKQVQQTRWSVMTLIDRWMLKSNLLVALGDFIAEGMARAMAKGAEQRGLHGDGSPAHARITGVFNWTQDAEYVITGDAGDDTFAELIDKHVYYLARVIGAMPEEYADNDAKWYGHRTIFFRYLGLTDSNGKPFSDVLAMGRTTQFSLMGYPFRFSRLAPKLTDAVQNDKTMLVLANLKAALLHTENPGGAEVRESEHYKFAEGMIAYVLDSLRGIQQANKPAAIQLKTAA